MISSLHNGVPVYQPPRAHNSDLWFSKNADYCIPSMWLKSKVMVLMCYWEDWSRAQFLWLGTCGPWSFSGALRGILRRWALDSPTAMGTCFKQRNPASIYMLKFHENLCCWEGGGNKGLLLKEFKEHSSTFKLCNDLNLYCLIGPETELNIEWLFMRNWNWILELITSFPEAINC